MIYVLITIAKWYVHFNPLSIDKMPLVLKHMLVNCNSNTCSEVKKFVIIEMIENEILIINLADFSFIYMYL